MAEGPIVGYSKIEGAEDIGNPSCKSTPIIVAKPNTVKDPAAPKASAGGSAY